MYKPSFVTAYKKSRSKLPIHVWHQVAGRHLPQFQTDEDVYTPVPINVKLSGGINDPNGSVRLSVCPTNKEWYHDLTSALTEMTGKRNIDVVNMEGKCISGFDTKHLFAAGECDIIDKTTKSVIRLESVIEPPLRMATNKGETLKQWWEDQSESISREVAQVLRGKNMSEIANATTKTGEVYKVIQSKMEQSAPNEFLKIYGSGLIRTSAQDLSDKLLHAVRRSLVANEQQIRHYHASNVTPDQSLWKQKETANIQSSYKDDFTLYRDIIDDAIIHPAVSRDVINSVLYGTKKIEGPIVTPSVKEQQFSDYHPLESFYKTYYYNTYGKLPGHVVSAYNKTIGTNMQQKMFPGDADEAFNVFHMLSGRAFDLIEKGGSGRGGGKSRHKKNKKKKNKRRGKKNNENSPQEQDNGVRNPDGTSVRGQPVSKRDVRDQRRRVRYANAQKKQEQAVLKTLKKGKKLGDNLVHISELLMDDGDETIASELVPIDSEMELPRLVPIDQEIGEEDEHIDLKLGPLNIYTTKAEAKRLKKRYETLDEAKANAPNKSVRNYLQKHWDKLGDEAIGSELPRLVPIDQDIREDDEFIDLKLFGKKKDANPLLEKVYVRPRLTLEERKAYETFLRDHKYLGFVTNDMITEAFKDKSSLGQKIYKSVLYLRDHKNKHYKGMNEEIEDEILGSEHPRLVPIDSEVIDLEVFGKVFSVDISHADQLNASNLYRRYNYNYDRAVQEAQKIRDKKSRKHVLQYLKYMKQQKTNVNSKVTSELVPIDREIDSELPRLVPLDSKPKLVPIESRLVPIPRDETLNSNLWDQKDDDELPTISQLLSGKY